MTTYNTGNPIGSTDARDRLDNSENMDILENSTTLNEHPDRLGVMRKTRKGMELEHDNQIAAHEADHDNQMLSFENDFDSRLAGMAFTRVGTFTTGATLTDMRQTLLWEASQGGDGHEYGWSGAFPKVVAAASTPATSGGIGAGAWVDRTQDRLRSDLNVVVKVFESVADMVADTALIVGLKCRTLGYYAVGDGGGNDYEIVAAATGNDDGGSYIDLSGSGFQAKGLFGSVVNVKQFGAKGDGVTDDTIKLQNFINALKSTSVLYGSGYIPAGVYLYSSPIYFNEFTGQTVFGDSDGRKYSLPSNSSLSSILRWGGDSSSSCIILNGFTNSELKNIAFEGSDSLDKSQTLCLVELRESTYGIPTGLMRFNRCSFRYATNLVQCGTAFDDNNCADVVFDFCSFNEFQYGLLVNTQQGLNYIFNFLNANSASGGTIFKLDRGGMIQANMIVGSGPDVVLELGRGGPNVGCASIYGVRIEKGGRVSNEAPKIVYIPDSLNTYVSDFVVDISDANTEVRAWSGYHNIINNGATVNISSSRIQSNFVQINSSNSTRSSRVNVDGCIFNSSSVNDLQTYFVSDESSSFIVRESCSDLSGGQVTNEYASGISSNNLVLLTDSVWVDAFGVYFTGTSSVGRIFELNVSSLLQGVGVRSFYYMKSLHRSGGVLSSNDVISGVITPASASYIEIRVIDSGAGYFKIQVRRVGGSSTTCKINIRCLKNETKGNVINIVKY